MENARHIEGGYIKLPRSVLESDLWVHRDKFRLMQLLIARANFQPDRPYRLTASISVGYGQYLRSYSKLQEDLRYISNRQLKQPSKSQIKRWVDELIEENRIVTEETELGTLFTVSNYHIYQSAKSYEILDREQGENVVETRREQSVNHIKKLKNLEKSDFDDEVIVDNEFFRITRTQVSEWVKTYPSIKKFAPELNKITDVLRERVRAGERIRSPMAFLHKHLVSVQERAMNQSPGTEKASPRRSGSQEPMSLKQILDRCQVPRVEVVELSVQKGGGVESPEGGEG